MEKDNASIMSKDYDYLNDSLFLYVRREHEYKESMELGNNIILDFDKEYVPVALEILDASKVLGIEKFALKRDFGLDMQIGINQDSITISATFKVFKHQKLINAPVNATIPNNMNLPNMQSSFELASV
jgi:uncharacterized protein YuzE